MILKKRFIKWLCLPIAISMASIPSSYALTDAQYKALVLGAVAAGSWGVWGLINTVVNSSIRGRITSTDGASLVGTLCGSAAAGTVRLWNPPTDPINTANLVTAAIKTATVPAAATGCYWITKLTVQLYFDSLKGKSDHLDLTKRRHLSADADRFARLKDHLANQIDYAGAASSNATRVRLNYTATCGNELVPTRRCAELENDVARTQSAATAALLAAKETAWDLASLAVTITNDEGSTIFSENPLPPRP
ncbi:hypothetical protein Dpoa2040_001350 [Dickeya sp. CFBP 2040]|uniref:hypothetical protein n=1 Tax=Dickeya sp. CFBP 2040 TaxID=2718531 RepID=UPI001446C439|nr:hypothetical protein [Dickeya sp. CFBP 2040]NKI74116.1 hypothetical protein [Dickeya sp. CFBP 2040]